MASRKYTLDKVQVNFCKEIDFLVLPGVGKKIAKCIAKFRDIEGNITPENIYSIPRLKVTDHMLRMIDYTKSPYYEIESEGEGDGESDPIVRPARSDQQAKVKDPVTDNIIKVIDARAGSFKGPYSSPTQNQQGVVYVKLEEGMGDKQAAAPKVFVP